MAMTKAEIDVPEGIVPYTVPKDKDAQIIRNAMLVYPYIKNGVMSHGKAAEMLGFHKIDLITLYGKLDVVPYEIFFLRKKPLFYWYWNNVGTNKNNCDYTKHSK